MGTRVYSYAAEPATAEDRDIFDRQLNLARDYKRALAVVENADRARRRALDQADPDVAALTERINALIAQPPNERDTAALADAKAAVKRRRADRAATDAYKESVTALMQQASADLRQARAVGSGAGLYWGTYLLVEDAHDRASRTTDIWQDVRPNAGGWNAIGVQIQKPKTLSTAALVGGDDTRLRLGAARYAVGRRQNGIRVREDGARNHRGDLRPAKFQELALRVGSTPDRKPIWCRFHVILHRPLPAGDVVWARVHRQRVGHDVLYSAQFVISGVLPALTPTTDDTVGVDIGWRRVEGGIRVGFAVGADWQSELVIPDRVLSKRQKAADLQSIRDQHMNNIRGQLIAWRNSLPDDHPLRAATEYLHVWRRMGKFVAFAKEWHAHCSAANEPAPLLLCAVDAWIHNDRHLFNWQQRCQLQIMRSVRDLQAKWASFLLKRCRYIAVEREPFVARMARRDADEHEATVANIAAAPAAVLQRIRSSASMYGVTVIEVPAAGTTRCVCGGPFADTHDLHARCTVCGVLSDQDYSAAVRIRASGIVQHTNGSQLEPRKLMGKQPRGARRNRKAAPVAEPVETG